MNELSSRVFLLSARATQPEAAERSDPSWFGFVLTVHEDSGLRRDRIVHRLEEQGIQTRMLFAGNLVKHPCFDEMRGAKEGFRTVGDLSTTDAIMTRTFWVGVYPRLTEPMLAHMIEKIRASVGSD